MEIEDYFYSSGLLPAAPVLHGYKNFWARDGFYVGMCTPKLKDKLWKGMIGILDNYKWKLDIHSKKAPIHWYEHIHVRYCPDGKEIDEPWLHNQFDSHANFGEVCLDAGRLDLADLIIQYLYVQNFHRQPAAGAWEDRNTSDAYSLASCIHFLQRSKIYFPNRYELLDVMVKRATKRLYSLLPYATADKIVCLSLLGCIWPFDIAGPYKEEIISIVKRDLMREPFGFIRYKGDTYNGEHFTQVKGNEFPWILGDLFMHRIEPNNQLWKDRIKAAKNHFGCMPEAYSTVTMRANRNTPLLWAESMYGSSNL